MGKWKSLLKLWPFLKEYSWILTFGIAGIIFSSLLATPIPYLTGQLLDKILIGSNRYTNLYLYSGIIAIFYLLDYVVTLVSKNLFVKINNSVVNNMRYSVMSKVIDLPMSYLSSTEKGYVQGRISECASIGSIFSPTIISMFLSIISAFFSIITMFLINYKLAIIVVVLTPVFFFCTKASTKEFTKSTRDMMESNAVLNAECFEIMNGIEDIKVLQGKKQHLSNFYTKITKLVASSIKQSKSMNLLVENIRLVNNVGFLLILAISGLLIIKGQITVGIYTSFSLYSAKVFASTQGIATLGTTLKPVCISIERLYELIDMDDENFGREGKLNPITTIEFDKVGFQYKNNNPDVFNNISFKLVKGDKVLLKGENGCGKSTLIKLLLGLYKPTSGVIHLNGQDSLNIDITSLRERISIVSQNIFLFRGTVLSNILYGHEDKNRQDVQNLIESFNLQDYVDRLAKGLDTEVNQNTSGVSGGQAQIIAFIRAFLSEKDVIILDEPISNVDLETSNLIIQILKKKQFDGILIIISHQTTGMDFVNKIIDIKNGEYFLANI